MDKLSVIIPTYNEIDYIVDAIHSVHFADEIIVIDSFSNDGTYEIVQKMGCNVVQRQFDTFSNQKNHAISFVKNEWILFIDADERVSQKLKIEIIDTIKNGKFDGYKITFPHFYMNR